MIFEKFVFCDSLITCSCSLKETTKTPLQRSVLQNIKINFSLKINVLWENRHSFQSGFSTYFLWPFPKPPGVNKLPLKISSSLLTPGPAYPLMRTTSVAHNLGSAQPWRNRAPKVDRLGCAQNSLTCDVRSVNASWRSPVLLI